MTTKQKLERVRDERNDDLFYQNHKTHGQKAAYTFAEGHNEGANLFLESLAEAIDLIGYIKLLSSEDFRNQPTNIMLHRLEIDIQSASDEFLTRIKERHGL